jgi:BlaI family transcriptional regulator, penicillinase repressor
MARRKTKTLTELELEIMRVVWNKEEATVEDIRRSFEDQGKPLALPSVRTMLAILQDKGYVARRPQGRGFAYRARVPREDARESIVRDLIDRAFDGSALGLVATLVGGDLVSKSEVGKVKDLIVRYKEGKKP